jgi:molybdopterin/thiamine biosynthesis adenylyltransferase
MLTADELERYARHIVLREVGGPGQAALGRARVLVVGAGGLGAPVLLYLAAAGVGTIGVVDDDVVSLSNLQRQVIHTTPDIGVPKVDTAAATIQRLNPHVVVEPYNVRLSAKNALDLIGGYDIVADGSDNFATRYLVSDACYFAKKPLVSAALGTFDGTLTTIRAHERGADGKPNPTYRCLFPEPPPPGTVPACAEAGILGALAGVIGSMMALEVIREIVGFGEGLVARFVMLDARAMRFETLRYGWDPANPLSGEQPTIRISVADATRFVMLKKPATAAMSHTSRSEKPERRSVARSSSSMSHGSAVSLTAKSSMARWRFDNRAAR